MGKIDNFLRALKAKNNEFYTRYEVKYAQYIPNDYYDYLYIPITAYIGKLNYFEYYGHYRIEGKDGKPRPRIKVKLKRNK